uniref:Small ribosomal subunit protein uS9c n=2 Tax=Blidingia minima TaxID=63414 RepID=A0A7S9DEF1_9CHLO|nr:30S ribosomal protein S9 [Blidingia minima]QPF96237.1 30S ribosomal protein S9 [Blidingia minima]QUX32867.1 30S ribosomal protein S9 [Blidingia minima]
MLKQFITSLATIKNSPSFYTQIKPGFNLTLKKKKAFTRFNSKLTVASNVNNNVISPVKPAINPTVIPDFPPKGPRPQLPGLEPEEIFPIKNPDKKPYFVPDFIPAKPFKLPQGPEPNKTPETYPKPKPEPKVTPKRRKDEDPFKEPAKQPEPSPNEPQPEKPKKFRRLKRRENRVMIDLTKLQFTSKQLTAICKKFSYFESNPNSKLKFKPDPESNVIYPGKAEALGRRKSSVAQVKLTAGKGTMTINGKSATSYLQKNLFLLTRIEAPLYFLSLNDYVSLSITVKGGGLIGQADAIKLGISRALCNYNIDYRYPLRNKGYLTRDARIKERKKYGLKKARKAPQYSKR